MALRAAQRRDMSLFADGLADVAAGRDSDGAEAALLNVAEILVMHARSLNKSF